MFLFTPLIPVFTPVRGLLTTIDRKLLVNLSKKEEYCSPGEKKIDSADTYQRKRVLRTYFFLFLYIQRLLENIIRKISAMPSDLNKANFLQTI